MKIKLEQIATQLTKQLKPVYLICGDEPLLVDETSHYIRKFAKREGYDEHHLLPISANFKWEQLLTHRDSLSLFSDKKIIELNMASGKPGRQGAEALVKYSQAIPDSCLLIVRLPKMTAAMQKTKWFSSLEKIGVAIQIWPMTSERFPSWLTRRLKREKLSTTAEGINVLVDLTEGNLLAAKQSIEKLAILYGEGEISAQQIKACLSELNHFDVYKLLDSILLLKTAYVYKILRNLKASAVEPTLILWVLCKEIRTLAKLAKAKEAKQSLSELWQQHGIWQQRQALLRNHLGNFNYQDYLSLLLQAECCDHVIKGIETGDVWHELEQLIFSMLQKNSSAPSEKIL